MVCVVVMIVLGSMVCVGNDVLDSDLLMIEGRKPIDSMVVDV